MIRFKIEHLNCGKINDKGFWVSDVAYEKIVVKLSNHNNKTIFIGYKKDHEVITNFLLTEVEKKYKAAKVAFSNFLKKGNFNSILIKSALFLASLDNYYRAGLIDVNLIGDNSKEVKDLKKYFQKQILKYLGRQTMFPKSQFWKGICICGRCRC
ncbi:MAG: hypothetical protein IPG07_06230 [Crocinitomicaceae bacterium]|nr:hypothetical protein [Crocinitomicaceae bacterium]